MKTWFRQYGGWTSLLLLAGVSAYWVAPENPLRPTKHFSTHRGPAMAGEYDFLDLADVNAPPCSQNYGLIDNCYNRDLPLTPSLLRNLDFPYGEYEEHNYELYSLKRPIDDTIIFSPFRGKPAQAGRIQAMPFVRSSNDGRLQFNGGDGGGVFFQMFRPENLGYDHKMKSNTSNPVLSSNVSMHPLIYMNPLKSRLNYDQYGDWQKPEVYHYNLCDASEDTGKSNPRTCQARWNSSSAYMSGDCYDVTVMVGLSQNLGNGYPESWELRSIDVTAFVPNAKKATAGNAWPKGIWVYPRKSIYTLPDYQQYYEFPGQTANFRETARMCYPPGGGPVVSDPGSTAVSRGPSSTSSVPVWCEYLYNQKTSTQGWAFDKNFNRVGDSGEWWDGTRCGATHSGANCGNFTFFELSTTADGKMLVFNSSGGGMAYSYNTLGACRADGFKLFRQISWMPVDSDIYSRYDIAKSLRKGSQWKPFRDSQGNNYNPGDIIDGAYGWIDRAGKNLFFANFNIARDGYKAVSVFPDVTHPEYPHATLNPDMNAGKGQSVMGAWTHGKIVQLDNGLNLTDFGGNGHWTNKDPLSGAELNFWYPYQSVFKLPLYHDSPPTPIRTKGVTVILSPENRLNDYDAMTPLMPFDVVWNVTGNNMQTAEVVFDEYHHRDAFVVAHMNSPIKKLDGTGATVPYDGFVPQNPWGDVRFGGVANFEFKENPRIQNASTMDRFFDPSAETPPANLRLRGGARVEPVAQGGVIGKGVFFDGRNDFMDMGFLNPTAQDWYYSIWLDSREHDRTRGRIIFWWPDGSFVGMSLDQIFFYNAKAASSDRTRVIDLSALQMTPNKYFHLGVKVKNENGRRRAVAYINGTRVGHQIDVSWAGTNGFSMSLDTMSGWSWFVVGDPGPSFLAPGYSGGRGSFYGWIDEFRIYRLGANEKPEGQYFDEYACNLALGSLVKVDPSDTHPFVESLKVIGKKHGLISSAVVNPPVQQRKRYKLPNGRFPSSIVGTSHLQYNTIGSTAEPAQQLTTQSYVVPSAAQASIKNTQAAQSSATSNTAVKGADLILSGGNSNVIKAGGGNDVLVKNDDNLIAVQEDRTNYAYICEQLNLQSFNGLTPFADQRGSKLCADKVHKNGVNLTGVRSSCARKSFIGQSSRPLKAGVERPDFSQVPFCLSCHHTQATLDGFKILALDRMSGVSRELDHRRQPMDHMRRIYGCTPQVVPYPNAGTCSTDTIWMDAIFDYASKVVP